MDNGGEEVKVCVQGLWHLGLVTASALASSGHDIIGLDLDKTLIESLHKGKTPISEPGLDELIHTTVQAGKLQFIDQSNEIPADITVLWVTYDTPVSETDEANVDFVFNQIIQVLPLLPFHTLVIVSSQMPVGSIKNLEKLADKLCPQKKLRFACVPENLRLGKALEVFLKPDRFVVGVRTKEDAQQITQLLHPITDKIECMSVESAEMTKHAINAFLATSVVFANEVASVCEIVGADAKEVERGLKSEQRIGPKAYLSPGSAFAGGTLARDIEFLKHISHKHQVVIPLLKSVKESNDQHKLWIKHKLNQLLPSLAGQNILVLGLTYKPGTNTLRRSLSVELCQWLLSQGANLKVHDPAVTELPKEWANQVQKLEHPLDNLDKVNVLIIGTEWPEYKKIALNEVVCKNSELIILDPNRFLSTWDTSKEMPNKLQEKDKVKTRLRYIAVGEPFEMEI